MGTNYYHIASPISRMPTGYETLTDADAQWMAQNLASMYGEGSEVRWVLERVAAVGLASEERMHIGKSSAGWKFLFQATDTIHDFTEWKKRLESGGRIVDQYGKEHSVAEFVKMVEFKQNLPDCLDHVSFHRDIYRDPEGYNFNKREFS